MGERTVRHWIVRLAPLVGVAALAALILGMGWNRYLSLDTLKDHGEALHAFVADHYLLTLLGLTLLFALLTASIIPGVVFVTVAAGYLYGTWVGGIATALGATLGALVVYAAGRSALGEALRTRARARPGLMMRICDGVDQNTFRYVLVSRLVVTVPFHLINIAAGIVSAPLKPYALATFVGLLPAHFIYCWIGDGLNDILSVNEDPDLRALFNEFAWPLMGVAFLALVLPLIMRRLRRTAPGTAA
ncbi:MAG: VTT domain-containing protein [Brevundimonas sp.]